MPRSKRRKPKRSPGPSGRPAPGSASGRAQPPERGRGRLEPLPSPRYTPPRPEFRIRPTSHRIVGWALVVLGVAVAVVNDIQWASTRVAVLPGGHSELYLLLAVGVAAYGAVWLGVFDRQT